MRHPLYFMIPVALAILLSATHGGAQTCVECHTKPKYRKEDMARLKECLRCHARGGHPGKDAKEVIPPERYRTKKTPDLTGMVYIPAGEFLMGTDDRLRDEKPLHVVYIDGFYMDRYEVTNAQYRKFIDATGHPLPYHWEGGTYPDGKAEHPVVYVSWFDAYSYCVWQGKRLPREREWEKAARGTDGRIYPWGDMWDINKSNNPLRGEEDTMPVGSFEEGKSPYGLYDVSGNVWEWVDDDYLPHPGSDYLNPEFGRNYKLLKGGSWWDCMFYGCGISAPTYNRAFFDPSTVNDSFGFRCAADVPKDAE